MTTTPPRVFISYSYDSEAHEAWVESLATRLLANGVDVIFDQWNLTLGSDLPRFMEQGLTAADRVLAICTEAYVAKSNDGKGGVGYEKMILSAQLMQNVTVDRIVPVLRNNNLPVCLPTFLSGRRYADFRDDVAFEKEYASLLKELLGMRVKPRPPIGQNPFLAVPEPVIPILAFSPERYVSPAASDTVKFDYENNNGRYIVGAGDYAFTTRWSGASKKSIYACLALPSIRSVARAVGITEISQIRDATLFDTSSQTRTIDIGEVAIWQNSAGYYLATKVEGIKKRGHGDEESEIVFSYVIQTNRGSSFLP